MQIVSIFILIAANAFFVAAEMGLARIRRTRVDQLASEGNKMAAEIQDHLNNPDRFISACQLGITLATLALGATGEEAFASELAEMIKQTGLIAGHALAVAQAFAFVAAFSLTAFLQTVFGELIPKTLTFQRAEPILFSLMWWMRLWIWLTSPFLKILNGFTGVVLRAMNISDPPKRHFVHSGEELKMLVSASHEEGVIEEKEEEMLHSVFDFAHTVAHEVMTPRTDMICVSAENTIREFVELALKHGHSRVPVFEEDIDTIFGAVHIRDGLRALVEHKENSHVREFARSILIVPENKDVGDLLTEFKKTKTHMAIVVDEYGGTRGLVTIEDLIEELVGDIADEHEIVEEYISAEADGTYLLDARLSLDELNDGLELEIEDEEFNTVGGHVFGSLGREPRIGDEVEGENYILRVEEADRHRILKLRLIRKKVETVDTNGAGLPLSSGEEAGTPTRKQTDTGSQSKKQSDSGASAKKTNGTAAKKPTDTGTHNKHLEANK
jgi:CBS domain containing-hemolysin-like protein